MDDRTSKIKKGSIYKFPKTASCHGGSDHFSATLLLLMQQNIISKQPINITMISWNFISDYWH